MLGSTFSAPEKNLDATERVEDWTRRRFQLSEEATVLASEIRCQSPGCPPLETVIVFWDEESIRYRFKVFKAIREVDEDDLPIGWLMPALRDYGDLGCDCC